MTGENKVYFDFSQDKLSNINAFLPKPTSQLLKDALKNIRHTVDICTEKEQLNELNLHINGLKKRVFTQQYIDYLSRYNKNRLSAGFYAFGIIWDSFAK